MDVRIPDELRAKIPQLSDTAGEQDPLVWARLANAVSGWRWYLIAMQQLATDTICYVYEVGWDERLTYFSLADLDRHAAEVGEATLIDTTFAPCRLSKVQAAERQLAARFPLGQVVATPGALAAFAAAGQSPLDCIQRHVQGDWGETVNSIPDFG